MMIRGIDRAHDIDMGPSGHRQERHHFDMVGRVPPVSAPGPTPRPQPTGPRVYRPRCAMLMPKFGTLCGRPEGHTGGCKVAQA